MTYLEDMRAIHFLLAVGWPGDASSEHWPLRTHLIAAGLTLAWTVFLVVWLERRRRAEGLAKPTVQVDDADLTALGAAPLRFRLEGSTQRPVQAAAHSVDRSASTLQPPVADKAASRVFQRAFGPMAAVALGLLFIPLRGIVPVSAFPLAFATLTVVASELGGRGAAVATALFSALSLDFFLTKPYLTLAIDDKHDVVAFVGLTLCGLVAAAFAARRRGAR